MMVDLPVDGALEELQIGHHRADQLNEHHITLVQKSHPISTFRPYLPTAKLQIIEKRGQLCVEPRNSGSPQRSSSRWSSWGPLRFSRAG